MREAAEPVSLASAGGAPFAAGSRSRVLLARLVVGAVVLTAAGLVLRALATGGSPFLPGWLFALSTAVVLGGVGPMALRLPPFEGTSLGVGPNLALIVLRSSSFLLYGLEELVHPLHLPAWGDVAVALQAVAVIGGAVLTPRPWNRTRVVRLALDGLVTACAVLLALWALVLGPRVGYRLDGVGDVVALLLCLLVVVEVTVIGLVLVRDVTTRPVVAFATMLIAGFAEFRMIASGLGGTPRSADAVTLVAWCTAWALFVHSVCHNRSVPQSLLDERTRRRGETRATAIATATGLVCCFAAVLAPGHGALDSVPGGSAAAYLALTLALLFGARELFLARTRLRLTQRLHEQADTDPLTGLANRRALTAKLEQVAVEQGPWVLLALDLDGFKAVNDVHGHAAGDDVLVAVAAVLRERCPAGGLAARTGGDEFAVLCPGSVTTGKVLAGLICSAVHSAVTGLGPGLGMTVSVGVGTVDAADGRIPDATDGRVRDAADGRVLDAARTDRLSVVVEAAAALRSAKEAGRDRVEVYPGRVARARERRLLVESRLREAVAQRRIGSVGQPIVDLRTGAVTAYEALARWDDDTLGRVTAQEFVAVAEQIGLVGQLGRQVLRASLEGFLERGLLESAARLSVNASPLELRHPAYVAEVSNLLREYAFPAHRLVVEVTEAVAVEEADPSVHVLQRLAATGVTVAVDDFGTGYSALGYLRRLPVHILKVDRSLLAEGRTTPRTRAMLGGVVELARRLDLVVTVEGVEDDPGLELARELGAHLGQGYLLGEPRPWADLGRGLLPARAGTGTSTGRSSP